MKKILFNYLLMPFVTPGQKAIGTARLIVSRKRTKAEAARYRLMENKKK